MNLQIPKNLISMNPPTQSSGREYNGYITRKELASQLNTTTNTMKVKLKEFGFTLPLGLVSPENQKKVRQLLGFDY